MSNVKPAGVQTELSPESENHLVECAIAGDAEAFGELYSIHLDAIFRYIYYRVGEVEEAEDLTEQVFLNVWKALPGYRRRGVPFTSWLYRIAHNAVVDYHRRRKPREQAATPTNPGSAVIEIRDDQMSTLSLVIQSEEAETLARAIAKLPDDQQQVIILRFIEGLNHIEIARIMERSEGACRMLQHRALAALNQYLEKG
jgi:RNA polymerase sigma-70 factor (ECF subfamily)